MLLADIDFTDYDEMLAMAQRAARTTDEGLGDHMALTAIDETYRPYAAAHDWLEANPERISEFTGSEGLKYDSLDRALAGLLKRQNVLDLSLGIEVPTVLRPARRPLISTLVY